MKPYEIGYLEWVESEDVRRIETWAESAAKAAQWFINTFPKDYVILSVERLGIL